MELFTNPEEKIAHLRALRAIAICDNNIDEAEKIHLQSLQKMYGVSESEFNIFELNNDSNDQELVNALSMITNPQHKFALIQDLITCAYCDGEYSEEEKAKLKEIGLILGIPEHKIEEIEELNVELANSYKKLAVALEFH